MRSAMCRWGTLILALATLGGASTSGQQTSTHTIEITGFKFVPQTARARIGDTIVFLNKDVVPHTATQQPAGWDSGTLAKDQALTVKVEATGTFAHFCRFHPHMKGELIVEQ